MRGAAIRTVTCLHKAWEPCDLSWGWRMGCEQFRQPPPGEKPSGRPETERGWGLGLPARGVGVPGRAAPAEAAGRPGRIGAKAAGPRMKPVPREQLVACPARAPATASLPAPK